MATIGLNVLITSASSYTVPASKQVVGTLTASYGAGVSQTVTLNGVNFFKVDFDTTGSAKTFTKPLVFNAGDVIGCPTGTAPIGVVLFGQISDV